MCKSLHHMGKINPKRHHPYQHRMLGYSQGCRFGFNIGWDQISPEAPPPLTHVVLPTVFTGARPYPNLCTWKEFMHTHTATHIETLWAIFWYQFTILYFITCEKYAKSIWTNSLIHLTYGLEIVLRYSVCAICIVCIFTVCSLFRLSAVMYFGVFMFLFYNNFRKQVAQILYIMTEHWPFHQCLFLVLLKVQQFSLLFLLLKREAVEMMNCL